MQRFYLFFGYEIFRFLYLLSEDQFDRDIDRESWRWFSLGTFYQHSRMDMVVLKTLGSGYSPIFVMDGLSKTLLLLSDSGRVAYLFFGENINFL